MERKKLSIEATRYIDAKSGCKKTVSAHDHAVTEFVTWAKKPKKEGDSYFVDEVSKTMLRRYFDYLVDGEEDDDGPANHAVHVGGQSDARQLVRALGSWP